MPGPAAIGMGLMAGGQLLQSGMDWWAQRKAAQEQKRRQGVAEPYIMGMLGGSPGQTFNAGQDAIMQMLRSNPWEASDTVLQSMVGTGEPFDLTELFGSLGKLDERAREDALASVRAGSTGLGQRFGTATMRESNDAMSQLLNAAAARNAGIAFQSHESAQGRRLSAADLMNQNVLSKLGVAQSAMGSDQAAQQSQMQALGLLLGLPIAQGGAPGFGQDIGQLGQLMALMEMLKEQ